MKTVMTRQMYSPLLLFFCFLEKPVTIKQAFEAKQLKLSVKYVHTHV